MLSVREGDAAAFTQLYNRHKSALLGFAFQMLRNWEDAADVFQDSFRYVYTHVSTYQPTAKFTTYLHQITRNMCIDILRKRRRRSTGQLDPEIEVPDATLTDDTPMERGEVEAKIKGALEEVPDPYREVLHLRIIQDFAYEEISQIVDCPVGTVKSRLHVGLGLLRDLIKRKKIAE